MTLAEKAELIKKWAENKQKHVRKKRDKKPCLLVYAEGSYSRKLLLRA
jgi:hypothetical protein